MNYRALIENRKSVRKFTDKVVSKEILQELLEYYRLHAKRLVPEIKTDILVFDTGAREALEGAAGYNNFLVGAPQYLVLLSEDAPLAHENAGYIMEDLILKLTDMDLGSCWITFTDSRQVKEALGIACDMEVAAIVAFGYGAKAAKRLRLNILSMSNVDISAKRHYFEPKRGIHDLVFLDTWGNNYKLDDYIGFFDDMLWEAFYAASLAPSYLNRQAYGFVLHEGNVILVRRLDIYNSEIDEKLSLGIVMLHFAAVAEDWAGKLRWKFGGEATRIELPEGYEVIASCAV